MIAAWRKNIEIEIIFLHPYYSVVSFPGEYMTKVLKSEMNYSQVCRSFNYLKANEMLVQDSNLKRLNRTTKGEALLDLQKDEGY
jgi:hypothetical protein